MVQRLLVSVCCATAGLRTGNISNVGPRHATYPICAEGGQHEHVPFKSTEFFWCVAFSVGLHYMG